MAGGAGVAEALLVSLGGRGLDRHDRDGLQRLVGLQLLDELQPADMRHLDIHDDEIGLEIAGLFHGVAAVHYRLRLIDVGTKKVAAELQIELAVFDNEDFFSTGVRFFTSPLMPLSAKRKSVVEGKRVA